MSATMANLFNTMLISLESIMLFILASGFFLRRKSLALTIFSFCLATASICLLIYLFGSIFFLKYVIVFLTLALWVFVAFETSIIKCMFPAAFLLAYLSLVDNIVITLVSSTVGRTSQELLGTPESYYMICFLTKTVELLGIVIIRTWVRRRFANAYLSLLDWIKVLFFPLSILLVSVYLLRIYYLAPEISHELVVCNAILLGLDVVSILVLSYLERQQAAIKDNIILRQNMKTQLDNVEAWQKAYDGQRKQTHDFQNQLLVLHGLVEQQEQKEKILRYIESLQPMEPLGTMLVRTHRTAVDIILNQKFYIAENRGIRFTTQLDDLTSFPLPDDALISVLSNLVDNAIEATGKVEDKKSRFISLKMKVEPDAAFLHIENSTAQPVHIVNNRVQTTKKNPIEHGYGLQNVTSILERASSIYYLNYDKDMKIFSFSAQIPIEQGGA